MDPSPMGRGRRMDLSHKDHSRMAQSWKLSSWEAFDVESKSGPILRFDKDGLVTVILDNSARCSLLWTMLIS